MPPLKAINWTATVDVKAMGLATSENKAPSTFDVIAYTGAAMNVDGYDLPVVLDLNGMTFGKSLIANLDHDRTKRVGHVTERSTDGGKLRLAGVASASTPARDEVINSAREGFVWQASIEATPSKVNELAAGKVAEVNGKRVTGPAYIVKKSVLKGFAFVSHGADDSTTVAIAASSKETKKMDKEFQAWVESMGFDAETLTADQLAGLQANYAGKPTPPRTPKKLDDVFAAHKLEQERQTKIADLAGDAIAERPFDAEAIEALANAAVDARWDSERFELELLRASRPQAHTVLRRRGESDRLSNKVIEAALCRTGGLSNIDKHFDDQTLDAAEQRYPNGFSIQDALLCVARANGCRAESVKSNLREVMRYAFPEVKASGFSTLSLSGILSATANKFLMEGWMAVDSAWRMIAAIRSVTDFKTVTSYSMTGDNSYVKVGPGGEIQHGTLGEVSYTNRADTYARMLAITRTDIINDDLGALTGAPKRLGRGAALKLNDVFWTAFLNNSTFFHSDYSNVSTGGGSALGTAEGAAINAAELKFLNQTDYDGKPLGINPAIMLVPPTLKNTAARWMGSQLMIGSSGLGDGNVYAGRFKVVSSPYMENSTYTGYSAAAWYLLADPSDMAVIEVAFLNGQQSPTVETADADFGVLGIQMRGYHDFGVSLQEKKAGVRSAGS